MKLFSIMLLCLLLPLSSWAADDIYLEGISVLGNKKTAHIVINGIKLMVKEKGYVGEWQVQTIAERSVALSNEAGEISNLALHSRLAPAGAGDPLTPEAELEMVEAPQIMSANGDEIPEGYRKVRTPFGELLVRKKDALNTAEPPKPDAVPPPKSAHIFFGRALNQNAEQATSDDTTQQPQAAPLLNLKQALPAKTEAASETETAQPNAPTNTVE